MTDGRFSGATRGLMVGHVGPEAFVGGPIALLRDGDIVSIDAEKGTINVELSEEELAKRKAHWKQPEPRLSARGDGEICEAGRSGVLWGGDALNREPADR